MTRLSPTENRALLKSAEQAIGMIPALQGIVGEAPVLLEADQGVYRLFTQTG